MKLSRDRRLVRWAFWLSDRHQIPSQTTLCVLFWRATIVTPAFLVAGIILSPIWVPMVVWEDHCQEDFRAWQRARRARKLERREQQTGSREIGPGIGTLLWQWAKAMKKKACPIVELVE